MTVKVKGVKINLGGNDYIVPPIALGALEQLKDRLSNFSGDVGDIAQVGLVIDCAFAAMRRNYPEMTRDDVADLIDIGNMMEVFESVMDVSGLRRKQQEAADAGEAEAAD